MTDLMKRYEAETGKVMSRLMETFANAEKHSKEELINVMTELYMFGLHLESQLTWRPVSEKPDESDRYLIKYRQGKIVKRFIADYDTVYGWNIPLSDVELIEWLPIPPAPEGDKQWPS